MRPITNDNSVVSLPPSETRYAVPDSKVPGLQLRVHPDGTKLWSLRYRAAGQQRRLKLGVYPRLSLSRAREAANRALRTVDGGGDPQAERQQATAAAARAKRDSLEALSEAYLDRYAKVHKRSWRKDQTMLTCEILPAWHGRAVSTITRRDCRELVQAIADRGPTYATAVARLLSKMFSWAVEESWIDYSPATRLIPKRHRVAADDEPKAYTPEEIRRIWQNTEALPPHERVPVRLGLWTGQRPSEISGMQWEELNGSWWTIPGRRTKNGRAHRVYLVPAAHDDLTTVLRIADEPYVFAGRRGQKQLTAVNVSAFAGLAPREKPRHALRHTIGTGMASLGIVRDDRAKVLNHVDRTVTGVYDHYEYDREKQRALETWARRLSVILEQKKDAEKVHEKIVAIAR